MSNTDRRDFMKSLALGMTGMAVTGAAATQAAESNSSSGSSFLSSGDTILFQGDSITDAGRSREDASHPNNQRAMGNGYAWMAAAQLLIDHPTSELKIYNRGISGNKVYQLSERWEQDCISLKPDVLSILIGVNDIWHMLNGRYDGTLETYQKDFTSLIQRTKEKLPDVKLVVCEPFVLKCGAVDDKWFPQFDEYRAAAKGVATTANALFVPFQEMFNEAIEYAPPEHWAKDGVHPSSFGAQLMAHEWVKTVHNAS